MPIVTTGLANSGRTRFFNIQYDSALTQERGADLAADLMTFCDDDLSVVAAWFSGRQLDMSLPISVTLTTVATDTNGSPTQYVGGKWVGFGPVPLQVTINIGDLPMASGTSIMLARYLLIAEVSEMYMRGFAFYTLNPWFQSGEGSKGEGLSRFLAAKFLERQYPGIAAIPALTVGSWNVSNLWLNGGRGNFIDNNVDDSDPDDVTGCATLFLFYLCDQLGFSIEEIINAGAGTLANVYENLTHDSWVHALDKFRLLVAAHCPSSVAVGLGAIAESYFPPLDTIFPVSELKFFTAPEQLTWVGGTGPSTLSVGVDRPAQVRLPIVATSSDPSIISPASSLLFIPQSGTVAFAPVTVLPQSATFTSKTVVLTATYAGHSLIQNVRVVRPDAMGLPPLEIEIDPTADPCSPFLVERLSQTFVIANLDVFADQSGLAFAWSVSGATPGAVNTATLTIPALPAAATQVTLSVTVTNSQHLQAAGTYSFQTVPTPSGVLALEKELVCRLGRFRSINLSLPPWTPIEKAGALEEQVASVERQLHEMTRAAGGVVSLLRRMKELDKTHIGRI